MSGSNTITSLRQARQLSQMTNTECVRAIYRYTAVISTQKNTGRHEKAEIVKEL